MTENEAKDKDKEKEKDNNEEELMAKIRDELLSLSQKFISMSNYLEKLKIEIEKDDISDINDDNKNENMNLLGKKRIDTSQINTRHDNNITKNNNNQKEKQIETISNSSINDSNSSIKISENRNRNRSKSKISQNKAKNKINENKTKHNSHNKKRKKLNMNDDYGNNEEEEEDEDEDEDEEEYINSDEESSSSSLDEKKTHKNHIKHRKKKIKQTQNGIISKIYPVKIIQNDVISAGYRVYCKCKGISMCFGPYADFNFAFDFRKLMHSQLKMFTKDIPDVLEKIEEFLKRTKEAVDKKQAPVQMLKKCKTINN